MSEVDCKPRNRRYPVSKPAVMKAADGHQLVSVINASSRGLGLRGRNLPTRGEYVEIKLQDGVIVGRVAWSCGVRCGVHTQDVVALRTLTDMAPPAPAAAPPPTNTGAPFVERRQADRRAVAYESSRASGKLLQFGFLAVLVFSAGVFAADAVRGALSAPMEAVSGRLAGR